MSRRTAALVLALAAFADAQALQAEAESVQTRQASDPSGADDMASLAQADRAGREVAADGRVADALVALRSEFPLAFQLAETREVPPLTTSPSPAEPITASPPAAAEMPAPVETPPIVATPAPETITMPPDPTGGPIERGADPAVDPSATAPAVA